MKKVIMTALLSGMAAFAIVGCGDSRVEQLEKENAQLKAELKEYKEKEANSISGKISTMYKDTKNWVLNLF